MRQLAIGLVFAAVMAMTAAASAQNAASAPDRPPNAREWVRPAPPAEATARPERMRPHRRYAQTRRFHPGWRSPADHAANRLNRQQLLGGGTYYRRAAPAAYDGAFGPAPYSPSGY
jgi:Ni/Co efflux regulator RcnB